MESTKKHKVSFSIVNNKSYNLPSNKEIRGQEYISWGDDNKYGEALKNWFFGSSIHNQIVLMKQAAICGYGLYSKLDKENINAFIKRCNNKGDSLNDIFRRFTLDYLIYGGGSLEICYSVATGKIAEIFYHSIKNLRFTPERDKIKSANNWTLGKVKTTTYERYNGTDATGRKMFYWAGNLTDDIYPVPEYIGTIAEIDTSYEISNYQRSQIKNSMVGSLHINFPNGQMEEEEVDELEREVNDKFAGSSNTGRIFMTISDQDGKGKPTIEAIPQPDLTSRLLAVQDMTRENILLGHGVSSVLLSLQVPGKLGGSSDYLQAAQNFNNSYVEPRRQMILDIFNTILDANFREPDLDVIPLKPVGNVITDQIVLTSQMTQMEIRKVNFKYGNIDTIAVPDGQTVLGDITTQTATDKKLLKPETNTDETNHIPVPDQNNTDAN